MPAGMPIPWFTYPAIDYIRQLDFSEKTIFEWGAGFSTLFWSSRAKSVISVETDPLWYSLLKPQLGPNCELILATREVEQYSSLIHNKNQFDVIIIDGTGESREACSRAAIPNLRRGGLIILDNSDLWLASSRILRDSGLNPSGLHWVFTNGCSLPHYEHIFFTGLQLRSAPRISAAQEHCATGQTVAQLVIMNRRLSAVMKHLS